MTASSLRVLALEDLIREPELLLPPPPVVPRLAWEGRLTLLASPEKLGKSTLVGQAVAAMVAGDHHGFLGEVPEQGSVLWLALDEPLGDVVRRLYAFGARKGVYFLDARPSVQETQDLVEELGVRLLVIDTLTEFAAGAVKDLNAAIQLQPLLKPLRGILQRTRAAGILIHHANRSTGHYRDSSQIGAGVDVIIEMRAPSPEGRPNVRLCKCSGRVTVEDFALNFMDGEYVLDQGELPLEVRVYRVVEGNPGISKRKLRGKVIGRGIDVDHTLDELLGKKAIVDRGGKQGAAYFTSNSPQATGVPDLEVCPASEAGTHSGTHPACPENIHGDTPRTHPGHTLGHTPVSAPLKGGAGTRVRDTSLDPEPRTVGTTSGAPPEPVENTDVGDETNHETEAEEERLAIMAEGGQLDGSAPGLDLQDDSYWDAMMEASP